MNRATIVTAAISRIAYGRCAAEARLLVHEAGGEAADVGREGRRGGADVADEVLGGVRQAVLDAVDVDPPGVRAGDGGRRDARDVRQRAEPLRVLRQGRLGLRGVRGGDRDVVRLAAVLGELGREGVGHLARAGAGGQDARVHRGELDAERRQRDQDQGDRRDRGHRRRVTHHGVGQPVPEAGRELLVGVLRAAAPRLRREAVDAGAEQGEHGGQDQQRDGGRDQGDHDARDAHGEQEALREDHQPGERGRDGHGAEQDALAGRPQGGGQRVPARVLGRPAPPGSGR